jgi:hypothetical protein
MNALNMASKILNIGDHIPFSGDSKIIVVYMQIYPLMLWTGIDNSDKFDCRDTGVLIQGPS